MLQVQKQVRFKVKVVADRKQSVAENIQKKNSFVNNVKAEENKV